MTDRPMGNYFSLVSALLLFLGVAAFSDNLFTDVGQASNRDPKFIVHGVFGLAWYVLLLVQANLGRVRNLRLHRRLGVATFVVAIAVVLTTLYLFVVLWKGWANMAADARANRLLLPGFAACLLLAWLRRGRADWHKRLVFVGTFFMLGPVLFRAYDPLLVPLLEPLLGGAYTRRVDAVAFQVFVWGLWTGFFLSLAVYDWRLLRRLHPVTMYGFSWFALAWAVSWGT